MLEVDEEVIISRLEYIRVLIYVAWTYWYFSIYLEGSYLTIYGWRSGRDD